MKSFQKNTFVALGQFDDFFCVGFGLIHSIDSSTPIMRFHERKTPKAFRPSGLLRSSDETF
jgi:hypothetical protein